MIKYFSNLNNISAVMQTIEQPKQLDPIIDPPEFTSDKFTIGDIQNSEAYKMYKKAEASFWVSGSIDCEADRPNFKRLKLEEQQFLLHVLAFFAASDGIVLENLAVRFYAEVQQAEIRLFYGLQMAIENIHSEVYTDLIKVFVSDPEKRRKLFRSIDESNAVQRKAKWAEKWIRSDRPFSHRLVAFAAVEGILFSASFCAIFYFKKRGKQLPGLIQSNEYISRDEALHCEFACLVHSQLLPHNQCPPETITEIIKSAVDTEMIFVKEALRKPILGMNAPAMIQYVKFVADVLLRMLKCDPVYNVANPFDFMNSISISRKSNFFENRVTEYSLSEVKTGEEDERAEIRFDEDF